MSVNINNFSKSHPSDSPSAKEQCRNFLQKIVRCLRREQNPLIQEIKNIAMQKIQPINGEEKASKVLEAIKSLDFSTLKADIKKIIEQMSEDDCKKLLIKALREDLQKNQKILGNQCLNFITIQQIRHLSRAVDKEFIDLKTTANEFAKIIQTINRFDIELERTKLQKNSKQFIVFRLISNLLRTIVIAFNLVNLGKEPSTYFETKYMLDIYWRLLEIPIKLIKFIFEVVLSPVKALVTVAVGTVASAISAYLLSHFFNRCPEELPYCKNLTTEIKTGYIRPTFGRERELDEIIQALAANNGTGRKHPMLVGKSGIGKTELMKALAWKLTRNDVPEVLKNKSLFYINSAELIKNQNAFALKDPLEQIRDKIGKHTKDVIIIFDEAHNLVNTMGERFNSLLDTSPDSLFYAIGITTPDLHKEFEVNCLDRRFKKISMDEPNEEQTRSILQSMCKLEAKNIKVPKKTLTSIYKKTQDKITNRCQPDKSILVLSEALEKVRNLQNGGEYDLKRQTLLTKKEELSSQLARKKIYGPLTTKVRNLTLELQKIDSEIAENIENIRKRKDITHHYLHLKKQLDWHEQWLHKTSESISRDAEAKKTIPELLEKLYLFNNFFLIPEIDTQIQSYIQANNLTVAIDDKIVDEVLSSLGSS